MILVLVSSITETLPPMSINIIDLISQQVP